MKRVLIIDSEFSGRIAHILQLFYDFLATVYITEAFDLSRPVISVRNAIVPEETPEERMLAKNDIDLFFVAGSLILDKKFDPTLLKTMYGNESSRLVAMSLSDDYLNLLEGVKNIDFKIDKMWLIVTGSQADLQPKQKQQLLEFIR